MNKPIVLLIATGAGLGINFPLGKLAVAAGISPAIWAAYISLAAGLALAVIARFSNEQSVRPKGLWRFAVISGFISFVMPNLLTYTVIPKIGSGLTGMMFALSPIATALLSLAMGVRPPNRASLAGIFLGLFGAATIIFGKDPQAAAGISWWLILALTIPLFLALGNVYRTSAWPPGASPRLLASLTNLAAVPFLLGASLVINGTIAIVPVFHAPGLMVVQLAVSTFMFLMFFRLQQIGGPTYLSQIGYVAAGVGLAIGVSFMGEAYPLSVWLGAAIIAAGIAISTFAQRGSAAAKADVKSLE